MSKSRLLISLSLAALILGCTTSGGGNNRIMRAKTSAVVIIHAVDASVDQDTIEIQARNGTSGKTGVPSTIVWTADDPAATLSIEFPDRAQKCVRGLHCSGNSCTAFSNVDFNDAAAVQCRYKTTLNGAVTHDPIVIIDNCCPQS
jgi:hypothetical protein